MARNRDKRYFNPPTPGLPIQPAGPIPPVEPASAAPPVPPASAPIPPPPAPLPPPDVVPSQAVEQVRHARRELQAAKDELTREREQLERVRSALAAQRLTLAANDEQIAGWRENIAAERARLEAQIAELAQRRTAMDRDLAARRAEMDQDLARRRDQSEAGLTQRQAELAGQVLALENRRGQLDGEISARLADLQQHIDRDQAEIRRLRESAERSAAEMAKSAEAQAADRIRIATEEAERVRSATARESERLWTDAQREAEKASSQAEQLRASAQAEADRKLADVEAEIAGRRQNAESESAAMLQSARAAAAVLEDDAAGRLTAAQLAFSQAEQAKAAAQQESERKRADVEAEVSQQRRDADADIAKHVEDARVEIAARRKDADAELARLRQAADAEMAERRQKADAELARRGQAVEEQLSARGRQCDAEIAARRQEAERQSADLVKSAQLAVAQAEQKSAELQEAARLALTQAEQAKASAEKDARKSREAAKKEAARLAQEAKARTDNAVLEADTLMRLARATVEQAGKAAAAERDRLAKESADRIAAADVARSAADAKLVQRRAAFEQETAEARRRIARIDSDEARLAHEQAQLAGARLELSRGEDDLGRRRRELAAAEQKLQMAEVAFSHKQSEAEDQLVRRAADADGAAAAVKKAEASLARQRSALDQARQTFQRQQAAFEQDLRTRKAQVEQAERDAAAEKGVATDLRRQIEERAADLQRELEAVRSDRERVTEELEQTRRQRADAERVTHEMEAQRDKMRAAEREVLGGWDEIRRGQAAVAKSREELDRQRNQPAGAAPAAATSVIRIVPRRLGQGTYRKWAAGLVLSTAAALLVTELAVLATVRPIYQSAAGMWLSVNDGHNPPRKSAKAVALEEWRNFLHAKHKDAFEAFLKTPPSGDANAPITGGNWRIDVQATEKSRGSAVVVVHGRSGSEQESKELSKGLLDEFGRWREAELKKVSPTELFNDLAWARQCRQDDRENAQGELQKAFEKMRADARLTADATKSLADVRAAVAARIAEVEAGLTRDEERLAALRVTRDAWQFEDAQLKAAGVTTAPEEEARVKGLIASLVEDRRLREGIRRQSADRQAKANAELSRARAEWDKASAALVDLLTQPTSRPSDEARSEAVRRRERAQIAYAVAQSAADPRTDPILRTWSEQDAALTERIVATEKSLTDITGGADPDAPGRGWYKLRARRAEIDKSLTGSRKDFDELNSKIEDHRAYRLKLIGDVEICDQRVKQAKEAEDALNDVQGKLSKAEGIAAANVQLTIGQAEFEPGASHNPRPAWMLSAAAVILLLAGAVGLVMLLLLSRPGPVEGLRPTQPGGAPESTGPS